MIKTILVPVTGLASDDSALETAYLVGRVFEAHVDCLHAKPDWPELLTASGAHFATEAGPSDEFISALEQHAKTTAWRANRHFAEFCRRWRVPICASPPGPDGISASWATEEGNALSIVLERARFHDLVVLGRGAESGVSGVGDIGDILIGAGRPLLIAPDKAPENLAPTVAIAWKNAAESARAVTAAMPLLAKAEKVCVLSAAERADEDVLHSAEALARQLRWHGIETEAHAIAASDRAPVDAVLDAARASGADLLVMGAYGHSRLREFAFGGFTRQVLRECKLPVFLFH